MERKILAKSIVLLLILALTMSSFMGCGNDSEPDFAPAIDASDDSEDWAFESESDEVFNLRVEADAVPESDWEDLAEMESEEWIAEEWVTLDSYRPEAIAGESEGNMGVIPIILASETGRQLVYTTDIIIETTEFMAGQRRLYNKIADLGGYSEITIINGRSLTSPDRERGAYFVFRLPPENLIEFIIFVEDNYQLVFLRKEMKDLTVIYERDISHLEDLRDREERLLENLEDEDNTREQRNIEQQLEDIQRDIRNLEEATDQIDYDVAYSDITIRLLEVILPEEIPEEEPPTFGERIGEASGDSLETLLAMLQGFFVFLIKSLPWLLPLVAILLIAFFVYRRVSKKRKNRSAPMHHQVNTTNADVPTPPTGTPPAHDITSQNEK